MPVITSGRFAVATSALALVVAMGGTGYAAAKIGTGQIKDDAVTSAKVKDDTLTGRDLDESKLGKVPSAQSADTATDAANVDGASIHKVLYRSDSRPAPVVLAAGGLLIQVACTQDNLFVGIMTSKDHSSIQSVMVDSHGGVVNARARDSQNFNVGEVFDPTLGATPAQEDAALLTLEYDATDGTVITGTLAIDLYEGAAFSDCSLTGNVVVD